MYVDIYACSGLRLSVGGESKRRRTSKVGQLDHILVQQQVGGLDVAVYEPFGVQELQAPHDVHGVSPQQALGEGAELVECVLYGPFRGEFQEYSQSILGVFR